MGLEIPSYAKCPQCGTEAKVDKAVYETFGVRLLNGKLETQSHCKKCRTLVLKGKLKDSYNSFKEQARKLLAESTLQVIDLYKPEYEKIKETHKSNLKKDWDKLKESEKSRKQILQDTFDKKCQEKKAELLKAVHS